MKMGDTKENLDSSLQTEIIFTSIEPAVSYLKSTYLEKDCKYPLNTTEYKIMQILKLMDDGRYEDAANEILLIVKKTISEDPFSRFSLKLGTDELLELLKSKPKEKNKVDE